MDTSNTSCRQSRSSTRTRHSLLTSTGAKWQALSQDAQKQFCSRFNRNKDAKWFKGLFCLGCNEVLRGLERDIAGVIFSQKLFSLGIGTHILTACRLRDVPCVILASNSEMAKWLPAAPPSPSVSCVGLRRKVDPERLSSLGLRETEHVYELARSALAQLIKSSQSLFEVPYLDVAGVGRPQVQISPPSLETLVVDPKIDYPRCMRRSEKRRLRRSRRKETQS